MQVFHQLHALLSLICCFQVLNIICRLHSSFTSLLRLDLQCEHTNESDGVY